MAFFITLSAGLAWAGPSQWVDPFIGTAGGGNTFPGALLPWGMVSVSPHNDLKSPSGYTYGKPSLYGFGHVHLSGTGCVDLGSVVLMPTTGQVVTDPEKWKSAYEQERAGPGYYSVHLKDSDIQAEMTATTHAGFSQYFFPAQKGDANILMDLGRRMTTDPVTLRSPSFESHVKIVSNNEVEGSTESGDFCSFYAGNKETVYFVIQFSKPAQRAGTWKEGALRGGEREQKGKEIGAYFSYSTAGSEALAVKVGVSYVSIENARLNLKTEIPGWDFQTIRAQSRQAWDEELSRIEVNGGTDDQRTVFYTALYHALIHPSVFSDVNGDYQAMAHQGVKTAGDYTRYHVFSLWDTYRNLHPFLGLFYPERDLDMTKSLVAMAQEGGWLPKWELAGNETSVMVGCPAVPVILDTYRQGLKHFDLGPAYAAMVKSLSPEGNKTYGGLKSLLQYGYIPKDDDSGDFLWGSVSTSLEYSYDFWCLAQMAKELKKGDDYDKYIHLSGVYRNLYDPDTGFLRAKKRDGSWMTPFDPLANCCDQSWPNNGGPGYVEGNAWNYLFFVPQDMDGLIRTLGGNEAFVKKLQECFTGGHFDATNEPDLAWPYLFDYVPKEGWRSQKEVRETLGRVFKPAPDGIPGNDDCGVMSAWYLFSALGFYPVCPGSNQYAIGSPLFREVDIHLSKRVYPGGLLTLKTVNNSAKNLYIQSIQLDGFDYKKQFFDHDSLVYGKDIVFKMDSRPRK